MSDINDENVLNEFEYTEEEKAELAKLDALNEDSDELKTEAGEEQVSLEDIEKGNFKIQNAKKHIEEIRNELFWNMKIKTYNIKEILLAEG